MSKKVLWLIVVVVVAIAIYLVWGGGSGSILTNLPGIYNASPSPTPATGTYKPKATPVAGTKSYTDYVKEYEGRRIQFGENCQMVPVRPTYKNGTSILLDNRSAQSRTIAMGGKTYSLQGYGYQVINLSSPALPKEMSVSCGSNPSVGIILLQALISQ
jgi:hypothetical protein